MGILIAIGVAMALDRSGDALDRGHCSVYLMHARSLESAVADYKSDWGRYPRALGISGLAQSIEPNYIRKMPPYELEYFSDGTSYRIFAGPSLAEPESCTACFFELADGALVRWPGWFPEYNRKKRGESVIATCPDHWLRKLEFTLGPVDPARPAKQAYVAVCPEDGARWRLRYRMGAEWESSIERVDGTAEPGD